MGSAESKSGGVSHQDTAGGCPVPHGKSASLPGADPQSCPVSDKNQMPTNLSQKPVSGQARQLDTTREVSSIPSVEGSTESKYWIYPSEQMFFDAMRRKNWDPKEVDMKTVVPIHNAVNERAWSQIMEWEKEYGSKTY
jgi:cytochrome c heme-lyase